MIYRLQRRFILICTLAVLSVVTLVFSVILGLNISSMNRNIDILADRVFAGGGRFPGAPGAPDAPEMPEGVPPDIKPPAEDTRFPFITPETPFSTRHFTVLYGDTGEVTETKTESIYSITEEMAVEYAERALSEGRERGWISYYRYRVFDDERGRGVVFVDGSMSRSSLVQSVTIAGGVLLGCAALVLVLILLLSKKAVKPIAESYEKQKQFVTNANHELKTPLTLILANLDIAEAELGENEWLNDIRAEGYRMTELVNQLVALSRMDEAGHGLLPVEVALGRLVSDTVGEFEAAARTFGKRLTASIDPSVVCLGDEALLCRLVGILLDNAVKYCDADGEITVSLRRGRKTVLTVENTYAAVGEVELLRLFDRFYRGDSARQFTGGYGIGLSMAKAILDAHKGEITAYRRDPSHIGFRVVLS